MGRTTHYVGDSCPDGHRNDPTTPRDKAHFHRVHGGFAVCHYPPCEKPRVSISEIIGGEDPEYVGCWGCAGTKERPECDGRCQRSAPYDWAAMLAEQEGT